MALAKFLFKVMLLSIVILMSLALGATLAGIAAMSNHSSAALAPALIMSTSNALVLGYIATRSNWQGFKLLVVIAFVWFGITTFLTQIETWLFMNYLVAIIDPAIVPRLFFQGIISTIVVAPFTILIFHQPRPRISYGMHVRGRDFRLAPQQWALRLIVGGIAYLAVYFTFGYFVFKPLAGSAFEQFYAGLQIPLWIIPFQVARGIVWVLIALPVMKMLKGGLTESAIAIGMLFSVLMGANLIPPNPFMPDNIRLAHLVEVATSNFVFGLIAVWLFRDCIEPESGGAYISRLM